MSKEGEYFGGNSFYLKSAKRMCSVLSKISVSLYEKGRLFDILLKISKNEEKILFKKTLKRIKSIQNR